MQFDQDIFHATAPEPLAARLREDPLLLVRIARRVAELERAPGPQVTAAAAAASSSLTSAPPAQVQAELTAMLALPGAPKALQWLHDSGLLAVILPEVDATVNFSQEAGRGHKDVWEHTKQVVTQAPARTPMRWAALLHDIGKVRTRGLTDEGKVHFHGHAEVGARMFDGIARRLTFERTLKQHVRFLILHHLRPNQYQPEWTDSAVRRFDRELQPWLDDLLDLSRADITSRRAGRRQEALRLIDELWERILALRAIDARLPPLPSGLGDAIMRRFGLPPSRLIGELRQQCEEAIARDELEPRREPEYYLEFLARVRGDMLNPPD